jgi:hypothetical protein
VRRHAGQRRRQRPQAPLINGRPGSIKHFQCTSGIGVSTAGGQ